MTIATADKLTKAVLRHGGNQAKAAKELGITKQSVSRRLIEHPELKKRILTARENAMKHAGISRSRVYATVSAGLEATKTVSVEDNTDDSEPGDRIQITETDFKERRESAKMCLQLFRDLEPDIKPLTLPSPVEAHLHLHLEKLNSTDLTNLLLGRFNGPSINPQKPR